MFLVGILAAENTWGNRFGTSWRHANITHLFYITKWYEWILLCNDLVECWIPCQLLRRIVSCNNVAPVPMSICNDAVNIPTCNKTAHVHTYYVVPASMSICNDIVLLSHSPHMMIQCLCNVTVLILMFRHNDIVLVSKSTCINDTVPVVMSTYKDRVSVSMSIYNDTEPAPIQIQLEWYSIHT